MLGQGDKVSPQDLTSPHPDLCPPPPPPPLPPAAHLPPPLPPSQNQDAATTKNPQGKAAKAVIEKVVLRGATHKSDDNSEYVFEVSWSDGFMLSVVRSHHEVAELMTQLSRVFPNEGLEKFLPPSIELDPRCLTTLPHHVLKHHSVQLFFTSTRPLPPTSPCTPASSTVPPPPPPPPPPSLQTTPVAPTCPFTSSSNHGCMVQYRGANRVVYQVASVQPVISTHSPVLTRSTPHLSSIPPSLPPAALPPSIPPPQLTSFPPPMMVLPIRGPTPGGSDTTTSTTSISTTSSAASSQSHPQHGLPHSFSQHLLHPQSRSQVHTQPSPQAQPGAPEQNGILDWLRRLRLHKYYPVFKQLTMEEFLALTEEDLNKYDLTQGAKKKLKTQLELQKSADREIKMEKWSCSSIARVTPSSHMGPSTHPTSTELRVEVDGVPHHHAVCTDSCSSSGYSSSSCSPRTPHCCDSTFDRARDIHRRVPGSDATGGPEKDRSGVFILSSSCPSGSSRPTAQVLPVQTDPGPPVPPSCSSSHLPFGLQQSSYHPQTLMTPMSNPMRILTSPHKPRPPLMCTEDRTKQLVSGLPVTGAGFSSSLSVGVRLESLFPAHSVDVSSGFQEPMACRGLQGGSMGLMVETSSALTSTSNSLHHVSHPPLHFHLSSSSSPSPSGCYSSPPTSSSSSYSSFSSSCSSTKPVVAGNAYYSPQPTSSPAPAPSAGSSLDQSSGHSSSMCVCSSCGCRGNCGAYGALPGYAAAAGYLQPFPAGPSLFTLGPLLHLSPLIASSSSSATAAAPFSYPMMVPPPPLYRHSPVPHDQQQSFGFYQTHGLMGNGSQKRSGGNLSCYNCGGSGHRADDCKQPPMDSSQQGMFRLKYTPHADSKDSGD